MKKVVKQAIGPMAWKLICVYLIYLKGIIIYHGYECINYRMSDFLGS